MEKFFEIGDVIRKLRLTKAKMDLIPFARLAGINKMTLSKIENGGNCGMDTLEKIAVALEMAPSEVLAYLDVYYGKKQTVTEIREQKPPQKPPKKTSSG